MDSGELVNDRIVDGGKVLARLNRDGFEVEAASWVRPVEDTDWSLWIVSPLVEREGQSSAYRRLHASLRDLKGLHVSLSDLTLIGAETAVARALLANQANWVGGLAPRIGWKQLGPALVKGIYQYPKISDLSDETRRMNREEIFLSLIHLLSRGPGAFGPSRIGLADGTTFNGVPLSFELTNEEEAEAQFIEEGVGTTRVVNVNDISSIE